MVYTLSHELYKYERGLTAAEQRDASIRAGEVAAGIRDLRLRAGRVFRVSRLRLRVQPARVPATPAPALSGHR